MRGTGGNRFIGPDAIRVELMRAIARGIDELEDWFDGTDRDLDIGALSIETMRSRSGGDISVSVTTDSKERSCVACGATDCAHLVRILDD